MTATINLESQKYDITNSEHWEQTFCGNRSVSAKVKELMCKIGPEILGPSYRELPIGEQEEIMRLYCMICAKEITIPHHLEDPTKDLLSKKQSVICDIMMKKQQVCSDIRKNSGDIETLQAQPEIRQFNDKPKAKKFAEVIEDLKLNLSSTTQLRDVGGGTGEMAVSIGDTFGLSRSNVKIYELANYQNQACPIVRYNDDGTIPEANNSIDLVTMNMVLHHVPDPHLLLNELSRVMKLGATFVMRETDTQGDEGIARFQHIMDQHWYKCNSHSEEVEGVPLEMQFRSKEEITALFEEHGFRLEEIVDHPNDAGNVFYPRFFVFKKIK